MPGNRVTPREMGYRRITPHSDGVGFLQPVFCCAQKRWWFTSDFGRLNFALRVSKFKMLTGPKFFCLRSNPEIGL